VSAADPHASEHRALLYEGVDHFVRASEAFVREGLERDEPVWLITGSPRIDALVEALGDDAAALELTPGEEWFRNSARTLTTLSHRLDDHDGPGAIRALGEIPFPRMDAAIRREWVRVEALLDGVLAPHRMRMLCAYDAQELPEPVLDHARRTHALVETAGGLHPSPAYDPAGVLGELHALPLDPAPDSAASLRFDDRPAPARDFVTARASEAGLSGPALADLRVAAAEVVTNAILHGRRPHWVHVWTAGDELLCEVQDGGAGIGSPATGFALPPLDAPAGRGVWIARQLCDHLELAGARVRLHFRLGDA
jgi:anti-sigma regulatory factor (Ser/Thr protein kinase)